MEIQFRMSGKVSDYRSFSAQRPRRFVVDLLGNWQVLVASKHVLGHHLAKQVRIGKHPDKLRVVMDLGPDASNDVDVQVTSVGFLVRISPTPLSPLPQ
ncbi:MAG: AMIN domain-containing protein [Deltaproteobacteria bacterium]|nr:AMIN domain-containing protein [Deltaproteobacteria bacterium]